MTINQSTLLINFSSKHLPTFFVPHWKVTERQAISLKILVLFLVQLYIVSLSVRDNIQFHIDSGSKFFFLFNLPESLRLGLRNIYVNVQNEKVTCDVRAWNREFSKENLSFLSDVSPNYGYQDLRSQQSCMI